MDGREGVKGKVRDKGVNGVLKVNVRVNGRGGRGVKR